MTGKSSFVWTVLSGCVYALSSVVFLMVVSHHLGDTAAGVYSAASMIAMQLITVGRFSVRSFQVSDVNDEYSFSEYFSFRVLTCLVMLVALLVWGLVGGYRGESLVIVLAFGIYKVCDAMADVFEGQLQRRSRLDVAGRCQCLMNLSLIAVFILGVFISGNLMTATILLAVGAVLFLPAFYLPAFRRYGGTDTGMLKLSLSGRSLRGLFDGCIALFVSSFLYSFMNNVPRYAIRKLYDGEEGVILLGHFTELFTPVFAVDLLAGFTMRLWLTPMAEAYDRRDGASFGKKKWAQLGIIAGITLAACLFAYTLGGPVLSWLYGTDLTAYAPELTLLMAAGGFVAVETLYENIVTIYRGQKHTLWINPVTILSGSVLLIFLVRAFGIRGAAVGYLIMTALRAVGFAILANLLKQRFRNS